MVSDSVMTFCRSALEILEGEVREELTNERDPGCSAKEDKTLKYRQRTSSVLHKYLVRFLIMRYLMVMMISCAHLVPWNLFLCTTCSLEVLLISDKFATCMLLFQVQIDHMARALARTFRSPVVETIQGLPQHQQVFSRPCNKFFVVCF
jgi:hypothetical protein